MSALLWAAFGGKKDVVEIKKKPACRRQRVNERKVAEAAIARGERVVAFMQP